MRLSRFRYGLASAFGLTILALLGLVSGHQRQAHADESDLAAIEPVTPTPFPPISFIDAQGQSHFIAEFKGKFTVLNLWATWCGPCIEELPALIHARSLWANNNIIVLAISEDRGPSEKVDRFLDKHQLNAINSFYDPPNTIGKNLAIAGLPTTFLIDAAGQLIAKAQGSVDWDAPEVIKLVKKLAGASIVDHDNPAPI